MNEEPARRDWLHLASPPGGADVQRTLKLTLALHPAYFDVEAKVRAALLRLPPRKTGAPERSLEHHAFTLACMILHPAKTTPQDRKVGRAAAARLSKAWQDLSCEIRSRVISRLVLTLGDTSIGHQQALARALPAAFERVARDMQDLVKSGRPVDQSHERALAKSLACVYLDLTGRRPSWSGGVATPFSRLVEEISALPGVASLVGHGRAAAERWRKGDYPLIKTEKGAIIDED